MSQDTTYRAGTCRWCGTRGEVYRDNGLCEQCDSDTVRCSICRCRQHVDNRCRHVFQDRYFEWAGSGVGHATPEVKAAFFELLTRMPEGFAADLRGAIRSGRFYTWFVAPLIGSGCILTLYGMPLDRGWGREMVRLGERDDAEETADGYHWLASLFQRRTRSANRLTVEWIDTWQREQVPHVGTWFWHFPVGAT